MQDLVKLCPCIEGPATFIRESIHIDGAWVTPDIEISAVCFIPFYFGVGDHKEILFDVQQRSLIGETRHKIGRPTARRLKCNRKEVQQKCNNDLELYCAQHRTQQKVYSLFPHTQPATRETKLDMEEIDKVITDGMIRSEKKCRKIRVGEAPF